jgi:hypothetical protein
MLNRLSSTKGPLVKEFVRHSLLRQVLLDLKINKTDKRKKKTKIQNKTKQNKTKQNKNKTKTKQKHT